MDKTQYKNEKRVARHKRLRAKVVGSAERPRLSVFRSNRFVYAQLIDDSTGKTIASADSRKSKGGNKEAAEQVGKDIAELAKKAGVTEVVFDRGGFRYQGSIATLAEAARAGGLKF